MNLKRVTITFEDQSRLAGSLGNWLTLSKFMQTTTEEDLLKLIKMEIEGRKRLDILHRLHSRFNTMRRNRERLILARLIGEHE